MHGTHAGPRGGDVLPRDANAVVDGVTTLDPGQNATAGVTFDGTQVHLTFAIPRGEQGIAGPTGQPGEVTQAALDSAISGTAQNPATVNAIPFSAPANYDQQVIQDMIDKINDLRVALVRP